MKDKVKLKSWFEDDKLYLGEHVKRKIDKLDEPETLSPEWIDEKSFPIIHQAREKDVVPVKDLKDKLVPKQELPVVDKEDAKNIVKYKSKGWTLSHLLNDVGVDAGHDELLARAWIAYPNIEVEEEQKFYVMSNDNRMMLVRMINDRTITEADPPPFDELYDTEKKSYRLTEKEIKDYDSRYWPFRKPVEEVE